MVSRTDPVSMPRNQQRSQLSLSYCTTSRKGGEVTTSGIESDAIWGVWCDWPVRSRASPATLSRVLRTENVQSERRTADFLRIIVGTSRRGGDWLRRWLILRWALTETAWFGGSV